MKTLRNKAKAIMQLDINASMPNGCKCKIPAILSTSCAEILLGTMIEILNKKNE
jgi:hypothetical protein|tara:strand:- start:379 stop:540 length:162 start_codon:yes stop_codon:yes gene_type:complete